MPHRASAFGMYRASFGIKALPATALVVLAVGLLASPSATAGPLGLGIMIGEPTGISLKNWVSRAEAFDAAFAWSFEGRDALHFHIDYLWHDFGLFQVDQGWLPLYYGVGARILFEEDDDETISLRVPVGLSYIFAARRVDLFVEFVPLLDLAPETDFDANASIGARYYFSSGQGGRR